MSAIVDSIHLVSMETVKNIFELNQEYSGPETIQIQPRFDLHIEQNTDNSNQYRITMGVGLYSKEGLDFPYHIEARIRAVFLLEGVSEEKKQDILRINCCALMFPYLRTALTTIMANAGIAPYYLPFMNMDKLFPKDKVFPSSEEVSN